MEQVSNRIVNQQLNDIEDILKVRTVELRNGDIYHRNGKIKRLDKQQEVLFDGNEVWIVPFSKSGFENQILNFAFVKTEMGFWICNLNLSSFDIKITDSILKHYYAALEIPYQTYEEEIIQYIFGKILEHYQYRVKVWDTHRGQIIIPEQIIKINGRRTERRAKKYYIEELNLERIPNKKPMQLRPDLLIETGTNTNGKPIYEFYEVELTWNKKKELDFKKKLFKLSTTQRTVNFIVKDTLYQQYYNLIEWFIGLDYIDYKNIRMCTISEFQSSGLLALKSVI